MDLLPLLQQIVDNHTNHEVRTMASDLRIAIATHGLVKMDMTETVPEPIGSSAKASKQKNKDINKIKSKEPNVAKPLIQEVESANDQVTNDCAVKYAFDEDKTKHSSRIPNAGGSNPGHKEAVCPLQETSNEKMTKQDSAVPSDFQKAPDTAFAKAMNELLDPLIPVRGHALITLRKLIDHNHQSVKGKHNMLLEIFTENLKHDDTYIYLNAVQGLIALGDHCSDDILPCLIEIYATQAGKGTGVTSELRMKVGEVLMRVARNSGKTSF